MSTLHGSGGFWNRVRDFFQQTLGSTPDPDTPEPASPLAPLSALLNPLDELRHGALEKVAQAGPDRSRPDHSDQADSSRQARARMKAEILELHRTLGTGLGQTQLEELSRSLKAHCAAFRAPRPDDLTELAMLAVMARLHREALSWAWGELKLRLEQAGLVWPEPTGLTPRADPEQVERHRRLHQKGLENAFVGGSFARLANLILGEVPAWGDLYPDPAGAIWRETVFEAVAGALACQRLARLESLAESEHARIEQLLAEALSEQLAGIQASLTRGVESIAEARRLSDQAVSVCQRVAPDVVWDYLCTKPEFLG